MFQWGFIYLNMTMDGNAGWSSGYNYHVAFNPQINILLFVQARNQSEIVLGAVSVNLSTFNILATNHSDEPRYIHGIWWLAVGA